MNDDIENKNVDISNKEIQSAWNNPLWMPEGSIRSILALLTVGTCCLHLFIFGTIPPELINLASMALGFYFGAKSK